MPLMVMLIMPAAGWAGKYVTYEGTIQGILCVHDKELCHRENLDMYLALEPDFVIVFPDGNHFLLPNLDRHIKSKYLERNVRISGEQESESIWVDKLEVKEGDQYRQVWSWKQQQEMYKGGGG
jgi:hypothetical protein